MGFEIDFLPVGDSNGDAICVRYGSEAMGYTIHIVDGGFTDTGQTVIDHVKKYYKNTGYIDHVVLSHADQDHACGLLAVMEHFDVGALWMNRPWLYSAEILDSFHANYTVAGLTETIREKYPILVELEEIAKRKNTPVYEAFAGHQIGAFRVLAPTRDRYLDLIPQLDRTPTSYAEAAPPPGAHWRASSPKRPKLSSAGLRHGRMKSWTIIHQQQVHRTRPVSFSSGS